MALQVQPEPVAILAGTLFGDGHFGSGFGEIAMICQVWKDNTVAEDSVSYAYGGAMSLRPAKHGQSAVYAWYAATMSTDDCGHFHLTLAAAND